MGWTWSRTPQQLLISNLLDGHPPSHTATPAPPASWKAGKHSVFRSLRQQKWKTQSGDISRWLLIGRNTPHDRKLRGGDTQARFQPRQRLSVRQTWLTSGGEVRQNPRRGLMNRFIWKQKCKSRLLSLVRSIDNLGCPVLAAKQTLDVRLCGSHPRPPHPFISFLSRGETSSRQCRAIHL